ncbi:MAG: cytochrome c [Sphingomonas sp.]
MRRLALLAPLALAACNAQPAEPAKAKGGPPTGMPVYQMRAEAPAGDRLAGGRDGAALFSNHCGACHLPGSMGTNLLVKQRLAAGQPPESALLTARTDLTPDYVKAVVRNGKMAMPRLSRVEVTDSELDAIAAYLGKAK